MRRLPLAISFTWALGVRILRKLDLSPLQRLKEFF
jgi:hypothetical protein